MSTPKIRRWVLTPGASWFMYGGGLVLLLCIALLVAFSPWRNTPRDSTVVLDLPLPLMTLELSSVTGTATTEPDPAVDASYRRAVQVQMADFIAHRQDAHPAALEPAHTPAVAHNLQEIVALEVITQGASLNVRSAPGTQAPVVASVAPGTRLRALAINPEGTWIQAHVPQLGEPGWVFAGLVQVVAGSLAALPTVGEAVPAAVFP